MLVVRALPIARSVHANAGVACCRRDQSPHDDHVVANNDPLPASMDDQIGRLPVVLRTTTVGDEPALGDKGVSGERSEHRVRENFRQAKTATNNLRAANQHTRDQLAADAARARDKATAAANHLKYNAVDAKHKASSHWE